MIFQNNTQFFESKKDQKNIIFSTIILIFFMVGLLFGEVTTDFSRIAIMTGGLATVISLVLGVRILTNSIKMKNVLLMTTVLAIWFANLSYSLLLFSTPIIDTFYNVATVLVMIVLYKKDEEEYDKFKNLMHLEHCKNCPALKEMKDNVDS